MDYHLRPHLPRMKRATPLDPEFVEPKAKEYYHVCSKKRNRQIVLLVLLSDLVEQHWVELVTGYSRSVCSSAKG